MKKKAFTLIELITVLVILAILALIVMPLVLNIIRKARTAADKRSIDAYGRSIEIAIAGYLLDNGTFPTSIEQLTIEYSGDEVVCSTTRLNGDSSVYLTGCTVGGRNVDYAYGTDKTPPAPTYTAYSVGDEVSYNNVDYYVIADSGPSEANVTLLKKTPLTVAEVTEYGIGHVNRYTSSSVGIAYDQNGYGGMVYYNSETCGYVNNSWVSSGCTTDYTQSEIKYVVDAWKIAQAPGASLARLITLDDLTDNLGMEFYQSEPTRLQLVKSEDTPMWVFGENYYYWTSSADTDKNNYVWTVFSLPTDLSTEYLNSYPVYNNFNGFGGVVRPVITINKSNL